MARSQELADLALELAQECLRTNRDKIARLAAGDREALLRASDIVRGARSAHPEIERSAEHIAFSLLTAAFAETPLPAPNPPSD